MRVLVESLQAVRLAGTPVATSSLMPRLIQVIVFVGGMSSIGIELTASRLIAPFFGSSTFIWANLIGLTLTFLSLGYFLGGRIADRYPSPALLFPITAVAACASGLIPIVSRPILTQSLEAFDDFAVGAFYGSLVGVIVLISLPVTLLGFVSPFAIRLLVSDLSRAGITAGNLYGLSTLGSIAGSFLPVILLIPWIGTTNTFIVLALALFLPSVIALVVIGRIRHAVVSVILVGLMLAANVVVAEGQIRPAERGELIYEYESAYNYIQVVHEDGRYMLALNEGHAIHSIYDPTSVLTGGPWDYFMTAPLVMPNESDSSTGSALIIGLAGGTVARQLTGAFGPIPIDGVEIDEDIARVGREYFAMGSDELPNLNVIIEDGRYMLRTSSNRYDIIGIDAYHQPYIPFQLCTKEFFQEVSDHLNPGGVAVINVGRTETDFRLVDVIAATMRAVFPHVYAIDVEGYNNTMLVGSHVSDGGSHFVANTAGLPESSILRTVAERSLATGNIREVNPDARVFTDDHAPVEFVVDQIILDVAREGEDS